MLFNTLLFHWHLSAFFSNLSRVGLLRFYHMASDTPSVPRVAILDDYQGVALSSADWTPLQGRVVIDVFRDTILDEDGLVCRLEGYDIICAMRERTKFPRSLLDCQNLSTRTYIPFDSAIV